MAMGLAACGPTESSLESMAAKGDADGLAAACVKLRRAPAGPLFKHCLNKLAAIATPAAADLFLSALDHDDPELRAAALRGLGQIRDARALDKLHVLLVNTVQTDGDYAPFIEAIESIQPGALNAWLDNEMAAARKALREQKAGPARIRLDQARAAARAIGKSRMVEELEAEVSSQGAAIERDAIARRVRDHLEAGRILPAWKELQRLLQSPGGKDLKDIAALERKLRIIKETEDRHYLAGARLDDAASRYYQLKEKNDPALAAAKDQWDKARAGMVAATRELNRVRPGLNACARIASSWNLPGVDGAAR
ncbi:MAG: hypothetical protein GMKNLPBB_00740 [Myxococcota bacterium]|nr:hypothetical protein [Myxococcota bacterium]